MKVFYHNSKNKKDKKLFSFNAVLCGAVGIIERGVQFFYFLFLRREEKIFF